MIGVFNVGVLVMVIVMGMIGFMFGLIEVNGIIVINVVVDFGMFLIFFVNVDGVVMFFVIF